jgi:hypothetical protein
MPRRRRASRVQSQVIVTRRAREAGQKLTRCFYLLTQPPQGPYAIDRIRCESEIRMHGLLVELLTDVLNPQEVQDIGKTRLFRIIMHRILHLHTTSSDILHRPDLEMDVVRRPYTLPALAFPLVAASPPCNDRRESVVIFESRLDIRAFASLLPTLPGTRLLIFAPAISEGTAGSIADPSADNWETAIRVDERRPLLVTVLRSPDLGRRLPRMPPRRAGAGTGTPSTRRRLAGGLAA